MYISYDHHTNALTLPASAMSGGGLTSSLMFLTNLNPAEDAPDSVMPASQENNYKKLIREEINLIDRLREEKVPSRITFYLRLLEMDSDDVEFVGVLTEKEINRHEFTVFIEKEKIVFASYMTNISIVAGLLAFAIFSILATSNPEPSALVLDVLSNTKGLLFGYIFLFQIAGLLAIGAMFTSLIWLIQVLGQTPTNEDGIWCMIDNNAIIPIALLLVSAVVTLLGEQCYIFLQYGWAIGLSTAVTCSVMVIPWVSPSPSP
jgi:hypothetical protein